MATPTPTTHLTTKTYPAGRDNPTERTTRLRQITIDNIKYKFK